MWFGETLPVSKAGDSQDKALTLPANPIFTHLLLGEICLPARMGGQSAAAMQPEAALGGEKLSEGIFPGSGLQNLVWVLRERGRERRPFLPAAPTHTPKGPPSGTPGVCHAGIFRGAGDAVVKERTKSPSPSPSP